MHDWDDDGFFDEDPDDHPTGRATFANYAGPSEFIYIVSHKINYINQQVRSCNWCAISHFLENPSYTSSISSGICP